MTHIDDWLETAVCSYDENIQYAAFFLHHKRLSATAQNAFFKFLGDIKLFCIYEGKKMQCTGAYRLGDVWLTHDFERSNGYDLRVDVADCKDWSKE